MLSRKGTYLQHLISEEMQKIIGETPDLLCLKVPFSKKIKSVLFLIKKIGAINFIYFLLTKFLETETIKKFSILPRVRPINFNNENSLCTFLKHKQYDLIVLGQSLHISSNVLNSGNSKFINIHPAKLPEYRGYAEPAHAILRNDQKNIGSTIHLVTPVLDSGNIIEFVPVWNNGYDSLNLLLTKTRIAGYVRLFQLIKKFGVHSLFLDSKVQDSTSENEMCRILPISERLKLDFLLLIKRIHLKFSSNKIQ